MECPEWLKQTTDLVSALVVGDFNGDGYVDLAIGIYAEDIEAAAAETPGP